MDVNNLLGKAAKDQLQQKAVNVAGEVIKKAMGGDEGKTDGKKDSGLNVGGLIKNVTGGKDDKGGVGKITSLFK